MKPRAARLLGVLMLLAGFAAYAEAPAGYYLTVDDADSVTLRQTLHALIDDHAPFPYSSSGTDTWDILEDAQEDPDAPGNILDIYYGASFAKFGGGVGDYDREHSWPRSYGFPSSGDTPFTDCHALFLCYPSYNSARGNRPFDETGPGATERPTLGNPTGTYPGLSNWSEGADGSAGSWEVWAERKGDIARAMFYMDVRYEGDAGEPDLVLTDNRALIQTADGGTAYMGMLTTLMAWHEADQVDAHEMRRNDVVYGYQGNRNPFVDRPEWVGILTGTATRNAVGAGWLLYE